jgi:hypothetical protein
LERDEIDRELERLALSFNQMLKEAQGLEIVVGREISETVKIWLQNEPSFPKPVAKPIDKRPPDKLPVYQWGGWHHLSKGGAKRCQKGGWNNPKSTSNGEQALKSKPVPRRIPRIIRIASCLTYVIHGCGWCRVLPVHPGSNPHDPHVGGLCLR